MDNQNNEARDLIVKAREALRRGDKETAHSLGEQAALLAPGMEDAWLILAASDPNPEDALAYAQQALEINPSSERALRAVEWGIARLKQVQTTPAAAVAPAVTPVPTQVEEPREAKKSSSWIWILAGGILLLLLCVGIVFTVYQSVSQSIFTSIANNPALNKVTGPTQEDLWAPMSLPKPSMVPNEDNGSSQQAASTPTAGATQQLLTPPSTQEPPALAPTQTRASPSTGASTPTPGEVPNEAATATPQVVTETPGVITMEIVDDPPTKQPLPTSSNAPLPQAASTGGSRWIDVDLTNQMVYAYEGETVVNSFLVSTGTWLTPTITGQYKVYVKYRSAPMSGPGYYLPDVPYIMYFHGDYGLHGTYWHSNFGTPMSHGCVNLRTDEAGWLYNWASVGTLVNIHY